VNFTDAKARDKRPSATLLLPLSAFADAWTGKPASPICVGLRLLSEADRVNARKSAEERAGELHPNGGDGWIECYNDAAKRFVAALSMCDPNDATRPHETFRYAEDQVVAAFTIGGTQLVFDAVEQLEIDLSPLERLADREVLVRLSRVLLHLNPKHMNGRLSRRVSCMLDELEPLVDELVESSPVDDAGDEAPIVIGKKRLVSGTLGPA
jgi:hypothetical protein